MKVAALMRKKDKSDFIAMSPPSRSEHVAHRSLQDVIVFNQTVEKEIRRLQHAKVQQVPYDEELLRRMELVRSTYVGVITGFLEKDENGQRHAMIIMADAIQDLLSYMQTRRMV